MRMLVEGVFFILFRGESSFGKMSNYLDDVNYKNDVFDDIIFFRESLSNMVAILCHIFIPQDLYIIRESENHIGMYSRHIYVPEDLSYN